MNKTLTMKIKVMEKLSQKGIRTEKDLKSLNVLDLLDDDSFNRDQLKTVKHIQQAANEGKIYSYLMSDAGETNEPYSYS